MSGPSQECKGDTFMCLDVIGIHLSDALMQDQNALRLVISFRGLRPHEAANRSAYILRPTLCEGLHVTLWRAAPSIDALVQDTDPVCHVIRL